MTSAETVRAAISGTLTTRHSERERASQTGDRRSGQSRERGRKQKSSTADGDEGYTKRSAVLRGRETRLPTPTAGLITQLRKQGGGKVRLPDV